jgi:hypothetical protein
MGFMTIFMTIRATRRGQPAHNMLAANQENA